MSFNLQDEYEIKFKVSQNTYEGFVKLYNDNNPLHTNEKFAQDRGFKGKVMHGNILNGYISYFVGECLYTKNVIIHSQEIQFKHPVYLNDELHFTAKITGIYASVNAIEFQFKFKNAELKVVAQGKIQIGILK